MNLDMESKGTQRERLLNGMVAVATRSGYPGATVSAVAEAAKVSKPTFYEQFTDRDDCFVACIDYVGERLLDATRDALADCRPERALIGAVDALVGFVSVERTMGRFLTAEAMAAGPAALEARDRSIIELAALVEEVHSRVPPDSRAPDLESVIVIGGVYRLLATRLRRGERWISRLSEDLEGWISSYEQPVGEHRWRSRQPAPVPAASPFVPVEPLHMPSPFPPGRPRLPEEQIAENHRLRIMVAAALLAERKGYIATTVADIVKLARVASSVFYRLFTDKQDAFMAAHAIGFEQVMDVTATAFFSGSSWPERSWEAGRAITQLLEKNPLVAHVGFVEAYAVGHGAMQRVEDSHTAFMIFLREGFGEVDHGHPPSRVALEAIVMTLFEILYQQARGSATPEVAQLLPHIGHIWLTPFLGSAEANAFIDRQVEAVEGDAIEGAAV